MDKSDFDQLLERYLTGKVTEQERIKIEAWLDTKKTGNMEHLLLSRQDEDKLFQKITAGVDNVEEIIALTAEKKTTVGGWVLRIAAGLLITSVLSYGGWYLSNRNDTVVHGGIEKLILNDGTLAWLRRGSTLVYMDKPNEGIRYAELTGEALFEVTKDADHPFIIHCGKSTIRVVGTSFSVRSGQDGIEVKVLTGKVHLTSEADTRGMDVGHNEKVVYTGKGAIEKQVLGQSEVAAMTTDTEYNMQFANTTMDKVVERIARKFNVKLTLANDESATCRITADFTDHSLESTLQMITEVLDVSYVKEGDSVVITGEGCGNR